MQGRRASRDYVSKVKAPAAYGGYELAEFTNGPRSGWMYTIDGAHPGRGVTSQKLKEGDKVILHYVNDYAWEVEDWAALGGTQWPQLSTEEKNYWNKWMEAPDINPPTPETPETPTTPEEPKPVFEDVPEDAWFAVTFLWRAAGKPVSNAANPFADVADGSFYYDAVVWAVEQGVTTGTSATTFEPDLNCTRAQVVTFMWREAK